MVVRVKLKGLKIARNKAGHYYVYVRGTKRCLVKNFEGTAKLLELLGEIDVLTVYNATRKQELNRIYADGTLGALVAWFKADCPATPNCPPPPATTIKGLRMAGERLRLPARPITTSELYDLRDRCAREKWPRFADKMIAAVSSMFTQAINSSENGIKPMLRHGQGPQGRSECEPGMVRSRMGIRSEQRASRGADPLYGCPLIGVAGQTIVGLNEHQFVDHPLTGKAVQYTRRKNKKATLLPVTDGTPDVPRPPARSTARTG